LFLPVNSILNLEQIHILKIEHIHLSLLDISKYNKFIDRGKMVFRMLERSKDLVCRQEFIPKLKFTYLSNSVVNILGYNL